MSHEFVNANMKAYWNPLVDIEQIKNIEFTNNAKPLLVFKHSTRCGISTTALDRFERSWNEGDSENIKTFYLDLLKYRDVSDQLALNFKIKHESPQVLLIVNGKCVYNASHFDINVEDIREFLVEGNYQR